MKKITIIAQDFSDKGFYNFNECMKPLLKHRKRISSWWYLHEELESLVGFDKGVIVSHEHLLYKEIIWKNSDHKDGSTVWMNNNPKEIYYLPDGVYKVNILGINKPCIGYFWTHFEKYDNIEGEFPNMRGLVCFKDDKEAREYAKKKFNEKTKIL